MATGSALGQPFKTSGEAKSAAASALSRAKAARSRQTDLRREIAKLESELDKAINDRNDLIIQKKKALDELLSGRFCSKCNRPASEIERSGISFEKHLNDVKGQGLPAPPEVIESKRREYDQKIAQLDREIARLRERLAQLRDKLGQAVRDEVNAGNEHRWALQAADELARIELWKKRAEELRRLEELKKQKLEAERRERELEAERIRERILAEESARREAEELARLAEESRRREALERRRKLEEEEARREAARRAQLAALEEEQRKANEALQEELRRQSLRRQQEDEEYERQRNDELRRRATEQQEAPAGLSAFSDPQTNDPQIGSADEERTARQRVADYLRDKWQAVKDRYSGSDDEGDAPRWDPVDALDDSTDAPAPRGRLDAVADWIKSRSGYRMGERALEQGRELVRGGVQWAKENEILSRAYEASKETYSPGGILKRVAKGMAEDRAEAWAKQQARDWGFARMEHLTGQPVTEIERDLAEVEEAAPHRREHTWRALAETRKEFFEKARAFLDKHLRADDLHPESGE